MLKLDIVRSMLDRVVFKFDLVLITDCFTLLVLSVRTATCFRICRFSLTIKSFYFL